MTANYGRDPRRDLSTAEKRFLYERANGLCQRCGVPLGSDWHAAHLISHVHGGATSKEAKSLVKDTQFGELGSVFARPALGRAVRRWGFTDGRTKKAPSEEAPLALVERLRRQAMRLPDGDLADLISSLKQEQRRRRRTN